MKFKWGGSRCTQTYKTLPFRLKYLNLKILIAALCKRLRRDRKINVDAGICISFVCMKTNGWQDGFK